MTKISGILNLTPDSFSDGGIYQTAEQAIAAAALMFEQGATWVDVGAESTRPGATPLSYKEEWVRLEPVLGPLLAAYPGSISLDTRHPEVLSLAARYAGLVIANDVSNFYNPRMIEVAAELGLVCIASHIPDFAKGDVHGSHGGIKISSIHQVADEHLRTVDRMVFGGVAKDHIILDPGFGYAKTTQLNLELVDYARYVPGFEVYLGMSRKTSLLSDPRVLDVILDLKDLEPKSEELNCWLDLRSAELAVEAARNRVSYIRAHNVRLHADLLAAQKP